MRRDRDLGPAPAAPPEVRRAQAERLAAVWARPTGWRRWSDVNNNAIGVWYVAATCVFFAVGGVLALLMRLQLAVPDNTLVGAHTYDQLFTMHGSIMMFLFAVPIFEAVSILLLPQLLGARDLPFPRLSAFGFWSFVLGGSFFVGTLAFGIAPTGGWFMYPPLTSAYQPGIATDVWLLALSFVEVSAIAAAVELIVGVLKCRPPGMRLHLAPLYAWYVLVVAIMVLFAFPPLIAGTLLLELERAFGWPFFDPARGGDPVLWQHLFWLFGHPEVYIVFLPSVALVATMLPAFTRVPVVGYPWVVLSAVGTGFLSFGLWVHHMFATGLPGLSLALFGSASMAVAIPTGVQLACFVATVLVGERKALPAALLFALGGLGVFVAGGLTGVMVAVVPFDLQAHDSHFVVAHLHTVLMGGTVFPLLGGLWYWWPLVAGTHLSERLGKAAFALVAGGFAITFGPMHWTGLLGMPRRVWVYSSDLGVDTLNAISTGGAFVIGAGFLVVLAAMAQRGKPAAKRDPWGAGTLEWLVEMPPDANWGVRSVPEIDGRYPLWDQPDLMRHVDEGRFFLPDAEEGLRETLVTSVVDARPIQVLRVADPSYLPMAAAFATGGFFLLSTFHLYGLALASAAVAFVVILAWLWTGTGILPAQPEKDIGQGVVLPVYASGPASVGWWAVLVTELAFLTAFLALVFGYFFYWTVHPDFPPADQPLPAVGGLGGGLGAVALAWGLVALAVRLNPRDRTWDVVGCLLGACGLAVAAAFAFGGSLRALDPTRHAHAATAYVLVGWTALQALVGVVFAAYTAARRVAGRLTARYDQELHNTLLFWHFEAFTAFVTVGVLAGFPRVAG